MLPADTKTVRVPAASVPGVKEGDTVEMKVVGMSGDGFVMLSPVEPEVPQAGAEPEDSPEEAPTEPGPDAKTLLGPMDSLKSYLVKKSMDPKQPG